MTKKTTRLHPMAISVIIGEHLDWKQVLDPVSEYFSRVKPVGHDILWANVDYAIKASSQIIEQLLVAESMSRLEEKLYSLSASDNGEGFYISVGSSLEPMMRLKDLANNAENSIEYRTRVAHAFYVAKHMVMQALPLDLVLARGSVSMDLAQRAIEEMGESYSPILVEIPEDPAQASDSIVNLIEEALSPPEEEWESAC